MSASTTTADATLASQYQRKTDKQHILDNPDTYIGSVVPADESMWIFDSATQRVAMRNMEIIPGLYKLFDEGIVNCRDHVIRMIQSTAENKKCVSYISIEISGEGEITFENDGDGIDVAKHPEYDLWIPEMIFGHLRTSTNYDKTEQKIVGGKNGFGFKLALIWSTRGAVETVDSARGLRYSQSFGPNLSSIATPTIVSVNKKEAAKPYTRVSFLPDYERLGIAGLSPDMIALFRKRAYDICATTGDARKIKVSFNGEQLTARTFQQYVDLYIGSKTSAARAYEASGERWEYAVALSPSHQFEQVSFVNGVCTTKGGKHVDYILGQITRKLVAYIEKKKKVVVAPATIREQLFVFLRCDINNPSFDSQTKDCLTTPSSAFGSSCTISDTFVEKIAKMGIMEQACALSEIKDARKAKKNDGAKTRTVRGIANFVDANHAGGAASGSCILILCEGLSAMSGVISGLSSEDRNIIGVYPLKGKLLNVRGEAVKRIAENKEITDLKRILGLELKREYVSQADVNIRLRYGKIMILTDADTDGSHIKALCINLFHSEWPSLFRIPGFLSFMNTPILTARKGNTKVLFYNEGEHAVWKTAMGAGDNGTVPGWTMKYFKGLGTSTEIEFKQYFKAKKTVDFEYAGAGDDDCIDKIFNKKRANERKDWLGTYDRAAYLDTTVSRVQYTEFVDRELIHFSVYDCERSIPSMVDGLKISQRKILFAAFKRNMTTEIKVAQFSGYVSEKACYHHGEASLNGAIVNMAQTFVGANNVNLLVPSGQFGSRLQGGKDSASERYIFTYLHPIARAIFRKEDDAILKYLEDDGTAVEPEYYLPIVPMALVNGAIGIGTGFSTSIPQYDLRDITRYLAVKLGGKTNDEGALTFVPWYRGFTGIVLPLTEEKFAIKGVYARTGENSVRITELPIGTWTMPYIAFLEKLEDGSVDADGKRTMPSIRSFTSNSTDRIVDIEVIFAPGVLAQLETQVDSAGVNGVQKLLGLTTTVSITNMHLFDSNLKLQQYACVDNIIDAFFEVRYMAYETRKTYLEAEMAARLLTLSNKARYIKLVLSGDVDLRYKTNACIDAMLESYELARENDAYTYLTRMPMSSVSNENAAALLAERDDVAAQLEVIRTTSIETTWLRELDELVNIYTAMIAETVGGEVSEKVPKARAVVVRKKRAV